jgi:outer membrane protein OmpA-like peptidoglycan-associated protein
LPLLQNRIESKATDMKTLRPTPTFHRGLLLAPLAALLLAACASSPATNPAVEQARAIYTRASTDADTARTAPLELRRAQEALRQADAALQSGEDLNTVEHYAYLARQSATTALQSGEIARAEQAVTAAGAERSRILITARGAEADQARAQAERERQQAELARTQAEAARNQAQQQGAAAQAAQARLAKLQQEMAALQAKQTDRGMVLTLGDVLFDTGRAQLKPGAFATLDRLAGFMRDNPERTLQIEGHTDSTGSATLNQALSQQRAESVRGALVSRGVDGGRITTKGMGPAVPVAGNDTAEGRQRNRRVEIVISQTS